MEILEKEFSWYGIPQLIMKSTASSYMLRISVYPVKEGYLDHHTEIELPKDVFRRYNLFDLIGRPIAYIHERIIAHHGRYNYKIGETCGNTLADKN